MCFFLSNFFTLFFSSRSSQNPQSYILACTDIVKELSVELESSSVTTTSKNTSSSSTSSVSKKHEEGEQEEEEEEGESLLLPFLKGILQNPKYKHLSARQILSLNLSKAIARQSSLDNSLPHSSSSKMNSEHNNLTDDNRLGNDFPTIEDSGTESGEDLRLLGASLNSMDEVVGTEELPKDIEVIKKEEVPSADTLGSDLLSEVTIALERLQLSLNQGKVDLDDNKKIALLSLVNRLQLGLVSPDKKSDFSIVESCLKVEPSGIADSDLRRGSSGSVNRFSKKKNRANRHTVGVTREELADARRIIEELEMIGMQKTANGPSKVTAKVMPTPGIFNAILTRQISEPVTLMRPSQFVPENLGDEKLKTKIPFKQSMSLDRPSPILKNKQEVTPTFMNEKLTTPKIATNGLNKKFNNRNDEAPTDESSSSDDEDMINTKFYNASNKFKAKENYLRNQQSGEKSFNYSSGDESHTPGPRLSKYTSKKMKMKRANTVDIPKSFSFVNTFDLSDRECSDSETMTNTHENRSTGLKTTFMAGNAPIPPKFTPKTDNDKKFMAFIQKQNQNAVPTYVNPLAPAKEQKIHNWTNKFGNLKHKFEDVNEPQKVVEKTNNAAAKFWKNIEKDKPSAKVSPLPAVPMKGAQPFTKALPAYTEKFPWKNTNEKTITEEPVTLKKKLMLDKFEPTQQLPALPPKSIPEPNKLPVLAPSSVNNFSHNPMSAFKPPISRKLSNSFKPISTQEEIIKKPMPQISNGLVKQMAVTGYNINNPPLPQVRKVVSSPTRSIADTTFISQFKPQKLSTTPKAESAPWSSHPKSERVLSLAASKFENVPTVHLASHLESTEPIVRFRSNPIYNGGIEKRSSLPPNATYSFESSSFLKNNPPKSMNSKEATFVITDFTQPVSISTYAPPSQKPSFERQDSLTNPSKEPLVLTCDRTVISPKETKSKPLTIFNPTSSFSVSPQISNDNSIGSICDDLEHELADIGGSIECQAAVSRVMRGPVAQTAFTQSSELTSLNSEAKENSMVKNLHDSLKKLSQKSPTPEKRFSDMSKRLSHDSSNSSIDLKLQLALKLPSGESESRLSKDSSNSSIDSKLPALKIPIPAVPETAYSITYSSPPRIQVKSPSTDPHVLFNNVSNNLQKVRSTHNLSIPKASAERSITPTGMYGVSQTLIDQKQRTVASFLGPQRTESLKLKTKPFSVAQPLQQQQKCAPIPAPRKISLQVKPMTRTSIKSHQSMTLLSRSKTMPSLANVELLDESNIDDAFEELLSSANL